MPIYERKKKPSYFVCCKVHVFVLLFHQPKTAVLWVGWRGILNRPIDYNSNKNLQRIPLALRRKKKTKKLYYKPSFEIGGIRGLKGSHNSQKKRFHANEVNALCISGLHNFITPISGNTERLRASQSTRAFPVPNPIKKDLIAVLFKLDNYIFSSWN